MLVKEGTMAQKKQPQKKRVQKTRVQQMLAEVESLTDQLRKRAAQLTAQVEKYLHQIRRELEGKPAPAKKKSAPKRTRARKTA